jgi:5-methylcytosine-specific restriction endonuclease McrA
MTGKIVDLAGCAHWSQNLPYRAVVAVRLQSQNGPMLYQVAGSAQNPCGAEKALRTAMKLHGGKCFYCPTVIGSGDVNIEWTLDHIEPSALGGTDHLGNLVIACKQCNQKKGHQPIDSFNPTASVEWLKDLQKQIQRRMSKLMPPKSATPPSSPPQPKQAAATGP